MNFFNGEVIKLSVDPTLYYRDYEEREEEMKEQPKCEYCKKECHYRPSDMKYKHNKHIFCSFTCRARWEKAQKGQRPSNRISKAVQNLDDDVVEE
jgi:hypothetical protein